MKLIKQNERIILNNEKNLFIKKKFISLIKFTLDKRTAYIGLEKLKL
jgi:hypothetical protein